MKKSLSFCSSCRIACLAVLISCFLLLPACSGEENSGDENSSPDTYVDNDTDESLAEVNNPEEDAGDNPDNGIDPPEEAEVEAVSSCEDYEMMNNTLFNCCGNNVCVDVECKIESCKAFCSEMLKGLPLPSEDLEILSPTQFFVKPIFTTCTKK